MESLEYLTLKRYRTQLEAAVQANLVAITSELLSRGLISKKSSVWLRDKSKSLAVRASNLVAMVMNGVRLKPDSYNVFVEVLQKCSIHIIQPIKADKARVARAASTRHEPAGPRRGTGVQGSQGRGAAATRSKSLKEKRVVIEGTLHKLGRRFKGWHRRYFRISGSHMYCYKTAGKDKCLGEISLANCHYCEPSTTVATFGSAFEIHTTQRSHTLAASSKEEMQKWIEAIKKHITISEVAYSKYKDQVVLRNKSAATTSSKLGKLSKRLSFNGSLESSVDMHRERYQLLAVGDLEVSTRPAIPMRKRSSTTTVRQSMSAEPLTSATEVGMSVDGHKSYSQTMPRPLPPRPITRIEPLKEEEGGVSSGGEDRQYTYSQTMPRSLPSRPTKSIAPIKEEKGRVGGTSGFVPTLLRNRKFQWDRVRTFLEYAGVSADLALHDQLPAQEMPWTKESSPVEQLRVFLVLDL